MIINILDIAHIACCIGAGGERAARILSETSDVVIPFGKYSQISLADVPLDYLDKTISVMPPTWLVRQTQSFVWACMFCLNHVDNTILYEDGFSSIPRKSMNDLINSGIFDQHSRHVRRQDE